MPSLSPHLPTALFLSMLGSSACAAEVLVPEVGEPVCMLVWEDHQWAMISVGPHSVWSGYHPPDLHCVLPD